MNEVNEVNYRDPITKRATYLTRIEAAQDPVIRYFMKRALAEWDEQGEKKFSKVINDWGQSLLLDFGMTALYWFLSIVTVGLFPFVYWLVEDSVPLGLFSFKIDDLKYVVQQDESHYSAEAEALEEELEKQRKKAELEATYEECTVENFKKLKHHYALGTGREDAERIVANQKIKLTQDHKTTLASLPLKVELDAMVQAICQTILTLSSCVSAEALPAESLKELGRQCEELEEQVDILKKEGVRLHRLFADHLLYISLERSLLKLDIEKARQFLNQISYPTIKKPAQARLDQFTLFAEVLAEKICQQDSQVNMDEATLADQLQQCLPFIAYVVRKNAVTYDKSDKKLMKAIHSRLSDLSNNGQVASELLSQAVTMVIKEQKPQQSLKEAFKYNHFLNNGKGKQEALNNNNNNNNKYNSYQK